MPTTYNKRQKEQKRKDRQADKHQLRDERRIRKNSPASESESTVTEENSTEAGPADEVAAPLLASPAASNAAEAATPPKP
jgi:hypothetical protein